MDHNFNDENNLPSRKADHVKLVIEEDTGIDRVSNGFENFKIIPSAIPEVDYSEISMATSFLDFEFKAPIMIAGMTGGYPEAEKINKKLASICNEVGIPMGVGSQRAMIKNKNMIPTYDVKKHFEDLFLVGNLGLVQFNYDFGINEYNECVEQIDANAMALHVNAFQELCQPEGDLNFSDLWKELETLCEKSKVPIIGKEVGSGIGIEDVKKFEQVGCSAIDVGGAGGTSWAKIELMRYDGEGSPPFELNDPTLKWGIPTAYATWEASGNTNLELISTGGMYHGLDAAKALAMGTNMVGVARPVLQELVNNGEKSALKWIENYIETIKRVMFLMGVDSIETLRTQKNKLIPMNDAYFWVNSRKNKL